MKILEDGQYTFNPEAMKRVSLMAFNAINQRFEYYIIIPKGVIAYYRASEEDEIIELEFHKEKRLDVSEFRKPFFDVALAAKSSETASLVLHLDDARVVSAMVYHTKKLPEVKEPNSGSSSLN